MTYTKNFTFVAAATGLALSLGGVLQNAQASPITAQPAPLQVFFYRSVSGFSDPDGRVADFEAMRDAFIANGYSADGLDFYTEVPFDYITGDNFVDALLVVDGNYTNGPLTLSQTGTTENDTSNIDYVLSSTSSAFPGGSASSFEGVSYDNALVYAEDNDGNVLTGPGNAAAYEFLLSNITGFGDFPESFRDELPFDINIFVDVQESDGGLFNTGTFTLAVNGTAVPEPSAAVGIFALAALAARRRRRALARRP